MMISLIEKKNIVEKKAKMLVTSISSSSNNVFRSPDCMVELSLYHTMTIFDTLRVKSLSENIVGEMRKCCMVTSIFYLPKNVFYPFKEKFDHLSQNEIVICKFLQFEHGYNFVA